MDDLENRSKWNNVVVWGVREGSENDFSSMEEFIEKELFTNHMQLEEGIEVMRAQNRSQCNGVESALFLFLRANNIYCSH